MTGPEGDTFQSKNNQIHVSPLRDLFVHKQGRADEALDFETLLARHYLHMATTVIARNLNNVLVMVQDLGDIPELEGMWRERSDEIGRFYGQLGRQFDQALDVMSESRSNPNTMRLLGLREQVRNMAPHIVALATWAQDLGEVLTLELGNPLNDAVKGHYDGYNEELDEQSASSGDSDSLRYAVHSQCAEVAADTRAQMGILSQANAELGLRTVADLLVGFSNPVVYIDTSDSSDVIVSHDDDISIALDLVLNAMLRGREDVTKPPELTVNELACIVRGDAEAFAQNRRLGQLHELLMALVVLKVSPRPGGQVVMSFALPERASSVWQPHVERLFAELNHLSPVIAALGGGLSQGTKLVGGNVEVFCELKLPGEFSKPATISQDASFIAARDKAALERAYRPNYHRMLNLPIRNGNGESVTVLEVFSAAFGTDEGRSCISRILPCVAQLSGEFGGQRVSLLPYRGCSSLLEAYATNSFGIVISSESSDEPGYDQVSELSPRFRASHQFLRRWKYLKSYAGEFSDSVRFVATDISLPIDAIESPKILSEIRAIGKLARLVSLHLPEYEDREQGLCELVQRVRKAIESVLDSAPNEQSFNLAINVMPSSAERSMLQFVCTDKDHVLYAAGLIGITDCSEEKYTFPVQEMGYLTRSILDVLSDLWSTKSLNLENFQRELRTKGCELAARFAVVFVETQIRREELLSPYEVNGILSEELCAEPDEFVIRLDSNDYRISLLSRVERHYQYGTDN